VLILVFSGPFKHVVPLWVYCIFGQNVGAALHAPESLALGPTWSLALEEHFYFTLPAADSLRESRYARRGFPNGRFVSNFLPVSKRTAVQGRHTTAGDLPWCERCGRITDCVTGASSGHRLYAAAFLDAAVPSTV